MKLLEFIFLVSQQIKEKSHHGESKEEVEKKVGVLMVTKTFSITIRGESKEEEKMGGGFDGDRKGFNHHSRMTI
jgi:hypothetical protein